jgi:hypothetical protein
VAAVTEGLTIEDRIRKMGGKMNTKTVKKDFAVSKSQTQKKAQIAKFEKRAQKSWVFASASLHGAYADVHLSYMQ